MQCVERAYYYPSSGLNLCRLDVIKQYLLYYEDVSILGFGFESLGADDMIHIDNSEEAKEDVRDLKRAGLLREVPPTQVINEYGQSLLKDTAKDIDMLSRKYPEGSVGHRWSISSRKIIDGLADLVDLQVSGTRWQNMTYAEGMGILLNHAFYCCMKENLAPFTDEELHQNAFHMKVIRQAKEILHDPKYVNMVDLGDFPPVLREQKIMKYTMRATVPIWPAPHAIRVDQLLEFRKNTENTRRHFRQEIARLAHEIADCPSEYSAEKRIDRYVFSYLNDLDSALQAIEGENLDNIISSKTALKGLFVSIGKSAIPILDLVFRVSRAAREGLTSRRLRRLRSNGLFYLLELTNSFQHAPR